MYFTESDADAALCLISEITCTKNKVEIDGLSPASSENKTPPITSRIELFLRYKKHITVHQVNNFTKQEFIGIFDMMESEVVSKFTAGKEKSFIMFPFEKPFMILTASKYGGSCEFYLS